MGYRFKNTILIIAVKLAHILYIKNRLFLQIARFHSMKKISIFADLMSHTTYPNRRIIKM